MLKTKYGCTVTLYTGGYMYELVVFLTNSLDHASSYIIQQTQSSRKTTNTITLEYDILHYLKVSCVSRDACFCSSVFSMLVLHSAGGKKGSHFSGFSFNCFTNT